MTHEKETRETLLVNPFPLVYDKVGHGTPIILIHGFPLNRTIWRHQVQALQEMCMVITPDLRGHGKSPASKGAYSINLMVNDVLETLNELRIEKAIWVGHSMGGYIALAAWHRVPERFLGFGLIASHHRKDTPEGQNRRYALADKVSTDGAKVMLQVPLFATDLPADAAIVQATHQIIEKTSTDGIIGALMALATRSDSTATAKSITVPSVVVAGAKDQVMPLEVLQETAALLPHGQLVVAENSGHMPMLEEPEVVSRALVNLVLRVNYTL